MEIRVATGADWAAIWPFFREIVADGETYSYPADEATCRTMWLTPPPGQAVVAVDGGAVVGTAKMGPVRPGRGSHVATASFMVAPAARRRGVGRALGEYVIGWAGTAGYRGIQFHAVVETNTAAVALWRSLGFEIIGTVPEAYDSRRHGLVGVHVMHRPCGPADPGRG